MSQNSDPHQASKGGRASWGRAIAALVFPLFMAIALPGIYLAAMHQPAPEDMRVEIVAGATANSDAAAQGGDDTAGNEKAAKEAQAQVAAAAQLATGLGAETDGRIDAVTVPDIATAKEHLGDLTSRAAYGPTTGKLYIASAGSPAAAAAVETVFEQVAEKTGATLSVVDTAPLPDEDRVGVSFMFLGIAGVLAGFTAATVLELMVAGISGRRQLLLLTGVSLAAGAVTSFIGYSVFGALTSDLLPVAGLVSLIALASGLLQLGGLRLIGPGMTLISIVLLILLGIPSSGAAVPVDMMPALFSHLQHVLSTSAGLDALRRVLYFGGAGVARDIPALVLWSLVGLVLMYLSTLKSSRADTTLLDVSMPTDPRERGLKRRRVLTAGLALPAFFMVAMPAIFLGIFHSPSPHEMKIAVVGSAASTAEVREQIATAMPDEVELSRLDSGAAAKSALRDQEIRAAFDPATGDVWVASAAGKQSALAAEQIITEVVSASGSTTTVHDVVALPEKDPMGNSLLYAGIGAIVGGFLAAIVLSLLGKGLPLSGTVALVGATAAVTAAIETAYVWTVFDIVDGHALAGFGVLFLTSLVSGMVTLAGFKLIGPLQIIVSVLLLAFFGIAGSDIGVQLDLAPAIYTYIHDFLPTPGALSALRTAVFFDGHGIERDLVVALVWLVVAVIALPIAAWLRGRRDGSDDGIDDEVFVDADADEAIAAAAAAAAAV